MRILFLAHFYFDIYVPIFEGLKNQGHEAVLVEDARITFDPYFANDGRLKSGIKKIVRKLFLCEKRYWDQKFKRLPELSKPFDVVFVIQGLSYCEYLHRRLKSINPSLKTSLYAWDTNRYYDFFRNNSLFDKVYTFDLRDSQDFQGVRLLPSYWVPTDYAPSIYSVSAIGSDHDDRLEIYSKIIPQLKEHNKKFFIRVVSRKSIFEKLVGDWKKSHRYGFVTDSSFPLDVVMRVIQESDCVLDTDMPIQTGATQRVIWALAKGKKVISTNTYLKEMPFYNPGQIYIIDRSNPVIDFDWLDRPVSGFDRSYFEDLRIDRWVKNFIEFD